MNKPKPLDPFISMSLQMLLDQWKREADLAQLSMLEADSIPIDDIAWHATQVIAAAFENTNLNWSDRAH